MTEKECIEYTVTMFASDPSGFVDSDNEEMIEAQYHDFVDLCDKHDINFEECITSWKRGRVLHEYLQRLIDIENFRENLLVDEFKELEKTFKEKISEIELYVELNKKYSGNIESVNAALMGKNYAEGMLKNLKFANLKQLQTLEKNLDYFKGPFLEFYSDDYLSLKIKTAILKHKRNLVFGEIKKEI